MNIFASEVEIIDSGITVICLKGKATVGAIPSSFEDGTEPNVKIIKKVHQ